ncbi:hypothetical protein E2P81_ATG04105 [Venturia nashicola]|uniref:Uncharacterized protein n=1 Tax=Venturia nashicola TaxID=86259 RepID=A0A4Z1PHK3_9PEZI|nr:hypothetical protein E6O75_ATG04206 [Venturia nashicola]TLD37293.1 hypothetical protein E2P81_ATG04105 [Venturia nashicola]
MPPKGRTLQEKNFAQTVVGELTSADNRQVLTAVGLFVGEVEGWDGRIVEQEEEDGERKQRKHQGKNKKEVKLMVGTTGDEQQLEMK